MTRTINRAKYVRLEKANTLHDLLSAVAIKLGMRLSETVSDETLTILLNELISDINREQLEQLYK